LQQPWVTWTNRGKICDPQNPRSAQTKRKMLKQLTTQTQHVSQDGFVNVIELTDLQEKSYSDRTGRFPVHSLEGNLYILVLYLYDTNAILVELLKTRNETYQVKAYERIMQHILAQFTPCTHMMDNEASKGLKDFLVKENNIQYQLVPPHIH
jgi:hypothetical protein